VQFDEETCAALDLLARDNVADLQELADEAFRDLLAKHGRPLGLKNQQAQSSDGADRRTQRPRIGNSVVPTKEGSRSRGETRQENQRAATAECRIDGGKAAPISLSRRYFFSPEKVWRRQTRDPNVANVAGAGLSVAAARPCPHVAAMRDGRRHEMVLWLSSLPPRDRLATMYAIAKIFPVVNGVGAWTAGITDTLAELQLTPGEHEDILIAAAELVERLIGG